MLYRILLFVILLSIPFQADSQYRQALAHQIDVPVRIPLYLSANFGELRNNHFHTGLDIKTQGVTGKPIFSIDDGYVSRISVSPWGYGLALYIDHPSGITTVYGHLDRFSAAIDSVVKARQYAAESFSVNLEFKKNEIPVGRGQLVAYSGNTGSSGGPHLHFEMRETVTERVLNPMPYYRNRLHDNRSPKISSLMVYPMDGVVNGSRNKKKVGVTTEKGKPRITLALEAWGDIALGVKANDYMDNTSNVYGVYSVELKVDSQLIFASKIDGVSFDENRCLNSFVDYEEWITNRSFVMKSFVDPGNKLGVYTKVENGGIIRIDEERDYKCVYILRDEHNNKTELQFKIRGVKQKLPVVAESSDVDVLPYGRANRVKKPGMTLDFPKGALYTDLNFEYGQSDNPRYVSAIHRLHKPTVPLHLNASVAIKINNDTVNEKKQYYLVRTDKGDSPVMGYYKKGAYHADIRYLGSYAVRVDHTPPQITPIGATQWGRNGVIRLRIGDSQSGVMTYRGEVDGTFVLLELAGGTSNLTYRLEPDRIKKGKQHQFNLIVTDACGNQQQFKNSFYW